MLDDLYSDEFAHKRISIFISLIGLFASIFNFLRSFYFRDLSLIEALLEPSTSISFIIVIFLILLLKASDIFTQIVHICIFLLQGFLSIMDYYNSFYGMGFILLAIVLIYKYGFLRRYPKIKILLLALYTLICVEISVSTVNGRATVAVDILLYFFFFLTIVYLAYKSEIKRILSVEKEYEEYYYNSELDKENLIEEINGHQKQIASHQDDINEKSQELKLLESKITKLNKLKKTVDLRNFKVTNTERKVIEQLCIDISIGNKEIGSNLNISTGTVSQHLHRVYKKLNIRTRQELIDQCKWNF